MPAGQLANRVRLGQRSPICLSVTGFCPYAGRRQQVSNLCQETVIFSYFWALLGNGRGSIYWSFTALSSWETLLPSWPEIKGRSSCQHPGLLNRIPSGAAECFYARGQQWWTSTRRHRLPSRSHKKAAEALVPRTVFTLCAILHHNFAIWASVFIRKTQKIWKRSSRLCNLL